MKIGPNWRRNQQRYGCAPPRCADCRRAATRDEIDLSATHKVMTGRDEHGQPIAVTEAALWTAQAVRMKNGKREHGLLRVPCR